jgi:hypothetical protein
MMDFYGWEIQENGEPGKGAKVTITIPMINLNGNENFRIAWRKSVRAFICS